MVRGNKSDGRGSKPARRVQSVAQFPSSSGQEAAPTNAAGNPTGVADEDPRVRLTRSIYRFANRTPKRRIVIGLVLIFGAAIWNHEKILRLPGVSALVDRATDLLPVPRATGDRFSIAIARLDNDEAGVHQRIIRESLVASSEVEVLVLDKGISIDRAGKPQEATKMGHKKAATILQESGADVLLWGTALTKDASGPVRLHWTLATGPRGTSVYSPLGATLDLPILAQQDLPIVLALLAQIEQGRLHATRGQDVAQRSLTLATKLEPLLGGVLGQGHDRLTLTYLIAYAYYHHGDQRSDVSSLNKAVNVATAPASESLPAELKPLSHRRSVVRSVALIALAEKGPSSDAEKHLREVSATLQPLLADAALAQVDPGIFGSIASTLGYAEVMLGQRLSDKSAVELGVSHLKDSLPHLDATGSAIAKNSIGQGLGMLALMTGNSRFFHEGARFLREALNESQAAAAPLEALKAQVNLGTVLAYLGRPPINGSSIGSRDSAYAHEAVELLQSAMALQSKSTDSFAWAATRVQLSLAQSFLAERQRDIGGFVVAMEGLKEARDVFASNRQDHHVRIVDSELGRIDTWLAGLREEQDLKGRR